MVVGQLEDDSSNNNTYVAGHAKEEFCFGS